MTMLDAGALPVEEPERVAPEAALLDVRDPLPVRLLREGDLLTAELLADRGVEALLPQLLAAAAGAGALFGLALGLPGGVLPALATAVKFPLILLLSAGVSVPALRISAGLSGLRLRGPQLSALLLQALATAATAMAALAPLAVVVWLTVSTFSSVDYYVYRRAIAAFTAVAALGGLWGASRLLRALPLSAALPWATVFALSGLQLSWLLRPVIGQPGEDFALLRPMISNGLVEVARLIATVLG